MPVIPPSPPKKEEENLRERSEQPAEWQYKQKGKMRSGSGGSDWRWPGRPLPRAAGNLRGSWSGKGKFLVVPGAVPGGLAFAAPAGLGVGADWGPGALSSRRLPQQ